MLPDPVPRETPAQRELLAERPGRGQQLGAQHQARLRNRLEAFHQMVHRAPLPRAPISSGRHRPLPGAPGGDGKQDAVYCTPLPGRDRRGPLPGRPRGPGVAAAGQGHVQAAGQGVRQT